MFRRSTLIDRLEAQARGGGRPPRTLFLLFAEGALIVACFIMLGLLLYAGQFSGTVRWFIGFLVVVAIAVFALRAVSRETEEPEPLVPPAPKRALTRGELSGLAAVVRRARAGLMYSQVMVTSRARDAFWERTRLARGLSPEAMRRLATNPEGLRAVLRDVPLAEFVFLRSSDLEERYRWVRAARARAGFDSSFAKVLDSMEAWH